MASLELDPASGRYHVRFRYAGQSYKRSLRTKHRQVVMASLGQVEETLRLLDLGMTEVPPKLKSGRSSFLGPDHATRNAPNRQYRLWQSFSASTNRNCPLEPKKKRTLEGERIHFKHLLRHLKPTSKTATLSTNAVQKYVRKRTQDKFHGKFIGPDTIKKEITTLRLVWNWAKKQGYLDSPAPVDSIIYPKRDEKPPFMTMAEIERKIRRDSFRLNTKRSFGKPSISTAMKLTSC